MPRTTRTTAVLGSLVLLFGCATGPEKKGDDAVTDKSIQAGTQRKVDVPKRDVSAETQQAFTGAVAAYQQQKKTGNFDYPALIDAFQDVLKIDPKLAEAYYNLGCIYEAMHEYQKAQDAYKQALSIKPDLTVAAANWGNLLAQHGKLDEALSIFQRGLSKEAKNSVVLINMAAIYERRKQYDKAASLASQALVRDPTNLAAYRVMASTYLAMGKLDMARLISLQGLKLDERDPSLLNTLGLILLQLKKVPEALANFRAALQQRPDMLQTRFNIAKVALDYKDFRVARQEFEQILQYEPKNKRAAVGLGIAMRGMGDVEAAKAQFEALAVANNRDPLPHQWLCRIYLRNLNEPKTAQKECKTCVSLFERSLEGDHPCKVMYREAAQGIEMEQKMRDAEKKALAEQKAYEEKMAKLAKLRIELVDKAWDYAQKNCLAIPPQKLDATKCDFIPVPLAITPDENHKVKLVGTIFKDVKEIFIGRIKIKKWRQVNEHTLEILAPKGLDLGPWDILLKLKGGDELYFAGGLWVGKKPKDCKVQTGAEPGKGDKRAGPGDKKGQPEKREEPKVDKKGEQKPEPGAQKGVQPKRGKKKAAKEPSEPKEPDEPK